MESEVNKAPILRQEDRDKEIFDSKRGLYILGIRKIERVKDEVGQLVSKKWREYGVLVHKIWESITMEYQNIWDDISDKVKQGLSALEERNKQALIKLQELKQIIKQKDEYLLTNF